MKPFRELLPENTLGALRCSFVAKPVLILRQWCSSDTLLPGDVTVLTKNGGSSIDFEQNYWRSSTSINFIFTLRCGHAGFVVGCVIVYQVLYSDVGESPAGIRHLDGHGNLPTHHACWEWWVRERHSCLALFGYLPAYAAGQGLYRGWCEVPRNCRLAWISPEQRRSFPHLIPGDVPRHPQDAPC